MPFKGTNREAYKTASKGKNPKERSEIYYKEKSKLEGKPSLFSEIKKALFGQKNEYKVDVSKMNHRQLRTSNKPNNEIRKTKFVLKQLIIDDIRDYRSSKIISNVSNFLATSFVKMTCKNFSNDQMNFFRSSIALITSETLNKALEKPLNIIDNIKMFIKVSKVVYKVVMYFDEKINEYCVDEKKIMIVKNTDLEYLEYLKTHPKIAEYEKRNEIIEYLGREVFVKIDRPFGSTHHNHKDIVYPINYGYLPNTKALDGEEQDAYILGMDEPIKEFKGIVKAIIIRKNDNEDKLVVCSIDKTPTKNEIINSTEFQEKYFNTEIIM